ncbi:uncharacterized protein C9orf85 homolog [Ornithodoros turicata]|uniref:Uncharacterized protein n=1 Tax=Ornithodoros turicata TaxID=34597 RepID=A0A2R5L3U0_9ACAR
MSVQLGNVKRSRPQKHQNERAFKNTLHDTSGQTKKIIALKIVNVCVRCKEKIEWKIKYKKYKPLTVPRKCVKCEGKTVKRAYHITCDNCVRELKICGKCGTKEDLVLQSDNEDESNSNC